MLDGSTIIANFKNGKPFGMAIYQLDDEKKKFEEHLRSSKRTIPEDLIYEVVSNMTKIPISNINVDERNSLINLTDNLLT